MTVLDRLGRPLGSLRLSVTDRCNMRCGYCMPDDEYLWLPRSSILSFEELDRIALVFARLGAKKIRLTGGEPLLRQDLPTLVRLLSRHPEITDIALTTNGTRLADQAEALRDAGLGRLTISLDTLRPDRLLRFARSRQHADIVAGIGAAARAGFQGTKINSVLIRGYNEDEIVDLLRFARERGHEIRFIEYMDVGGATRWRREDVVSRDEILSVVTQAFGMVEPIPGRGEAPAEAFQLDDGTRFGIIASTTAPFCRACDRSRVTADGTWFQCLYADQGVDLRGPLRAGASDRALEELITESWSARRDRGAEQRLALRERGVLHTLQGLRADPRREMHTRGG